MEERFLRQVRIDYHGIWILGYGIIFLFLRDDEFADRVD